MRDKNVDPKVVAGDVVSVKGVRAKNEASMNIGTATIMKDGKKIFSGNYE
jgi:hypothetical protein